MVRACGAGSPTDRRTLLLALSRVLRYPEDDIHGIGREGGGGADSETVPTSINEGPRALTKVTLRRATPVDASRNSRPSPGAPSPTPLHPHPEGENFHTGRCTGNQEKGIGRKSVGRLKTPDGQTTGDQTLLEVDGQLNRHG